MQNFGGGLLKVFFGNVTKSKFHSPKHSKANRWDVMYKRVYSRGSQRKDIIGQASNLPPRRGREVFYNNRGWDYIYIDEKCGENLWLFIRKDGTCLLSKCVTYILYSWWRLKMRQNSAPTIRHLKTRKGTMGFLQESRDKLEGLLRSLSRVRKIGPCCS